MMRIRMSEVAPHIVIRHDQESDYLDAESALSKIKEGPQGRKLLDEIKKYSTDGRSCLIQPSRINFNYSYPVLTQPQKEKLFPEQAFFHELQHIDTSTKLSNKRSFGRKGEGTSATIEWNPTYAVRVLHEGMHFAISDESAGFTNLAGELIHAYRMMKGTYLVHNEWTDPKLEKRLIYEESRAIGLGKHAKRAFTENGIRKEHGIEPREKYSLDGDDFFF